MIMMILKTGFMINYKQIIEINDEIEMVIIIKNRFIKSIFEIDESGRKWY